MTNQIIIAKGGGGGGRGGGGARSSVGSKSSSTTSKSSGTTTKTNPAPKTNTAPKVAAPAKKPAATTVKKTETTAKKVEGKTYSKTGYVTSAEYQPRFTGGYTPPVGSTVYYRDSHSGFMDFLPWYFLLTHDSHREAVITQPDGKQVVQKSEGVDGMYIFNWFMMILLTGAIIFGIVYWVNKRTRKEQYV